MAMKMNQQTLTDRNRIAWEASSYEAWVNRYGTPVTAATNIMSDPRHTLRRVLKFVGNPQGQAVVNPLGSHGRVATALALLEADVTVFDVSDSNARYARELATCAGAVVEYIVGDFQQVAVRYLNKFDVAVMELGIVHYFVKIEAFVASVRKLLKPGGKLVLNEFHPLLKKSVVINSGQPTFNGNYFNTDCEEATTPYEPFTENVVPPCLIRRWNLGEIVTAFASGGFIIEQLIEHPSPEFDQLPGTFTLAARAA